MIVIFKDVEGVIVVMGWLEDFDVEIEMDEEEFVKVIDSKSKYKIGKCLFWYFDD